MTCMVLASQDMQWLASWAKKRVNNDIKVETNKLIAYRSIAERFKNNSVLVDRGEKRLVYM